MKAAGPTLLCLIATGTLAAREPTVPATLSSRLSAEVRASLPAYTPPPPKPENTPAGPAPADPDVLVLPKLTVREKRVQRLDPLDILSPREQDKKYAAEYRASLKGLDALLNGFAIPLIGQSLAARGRALHAQRQFEDLHFISTVGASLDPEGAAATKKAEDDMKRAIDWQNRPAGSK